MTPPREPDAMERAIAANIAGHHAEQSAQRERATMLVAMSPEVVEALTAQGWEFGERGPDGFHSPIVRVEAAGAPLRETLESLLAIDENIRAGGYEESAPGWDDAVQQARAALAATPAPAPLDAIEVAERVVATIEGAIEDEPPEWLEAAFADAIASERARLAATPAPAPLDGRAVHAAWRDGMQEQGRFVPIERLTWDHLPEQDKALDEGIAARLTARAAATEDTDAQ